MALARKARRRWPPESDPICDERRHAMPTRSSARATASWSSCPGRRHGPSRGKRPIIATSQTETGNDQSTNSACGTYAIRLASLPAGSPSTSTTPLHGWIRSATSLSSVDFPPPLGPKMATSEPAGISRSTSSSASRWSYPAVTCASRTAALMEVVGGALIGSAQRRYELPGIPADDRLVARHRSIPQGIVVQVGHHLGAGLGGKLLDELRGELALTEDRLHAGIANGIDEARRVSGARVLPRRGDGDAHDRDPIFASVVRKRVVEGDELAIGGGDRGDLRPHPLVERLEPRLVGRGLFVDAACILPVDLLQTSRDAIHVQLRVLGIHEQVRVLGAGVLPGEQGDAWQIHGQCHQRRT